MPKSLDNEVTTTDVLGKQPKENELVRNSPVCPENPPANQSQDDAQKENQTSPETFNEPVICMDNVTISSNDGKTKDVPNPDRIESSDGSNSLSLNEIESVPQNQSAHDGQMSSVSDSPSDADCTPLIEAIGKDMDKDHLKTLVTVSPAPVCLQQENIVKYAVSPEFSKDTGDDGPNVEDGNLQSEQNEISMDAAVPEQSLDHLLSSRDPDKTAVMVCSDIPVLSTTECEQVVMADLSEVSVSVTDMAFDESELTWSASGVGEESGISSMTVSPDLPDIECDLTPVEVALSLTNRDPKSEDRVKAPFVSNDPAEMVLEFCHSHLSKQAHGEHTEAYYRLSPTKQDPFGHEMEVKSKQDTDQLKALVVTSDFCLVEEFRTEMAIKTDVEIKQKEMAEGEDKMTEISIMEATMDTNEWITDDNHEALPWMNISISSLPHNTQTGPVFSEHNSGSADDGAYETADPPLLTEVDQSSSVEKSKGGDKKVVAVQPMPQNVNVTFRIHYLTHSPYQEVAITGNQLELGNWKGFIPLEKAKDGHWSTVINLPAESHVEWKFVVVDRGEVCRWEECCNRLLDTGYAEDLLVHKWWGFV